MLCSCLYLILLSLMSSWFSWVQSYLQSQAADIHALWLLLPRFFTCIGPLWFSYFPPPSPPPPLILGVGFGRKNHFAAVRKEYFFICIHIHIYIHIYMYTHMHAHTHTPLSLFSSMILSPRHYTFWFLIQWNQTGREREMHAIIKTSA